MLTVRRITVEEGYNEQIDSRIAQNIRSFCKWIFPGGDLRVRLSGTTHFEPSLRWIVLRDEHGGECGFSLPYCNSDSEYFATIFEVASAIESEHIENAIHCVPPFEFIFPLFVHEAEVYGTQINRGVVKCLYAETSEVLLPVGGDVMEHGPSSAPIRGKINARVRLTAGSEIFAGASYSLNETQLDFFVNFSGCKFSARFRGAGDTAIFVLGERIMENTATNEKLEEVVNHGSIPVTLDLGAIEISLEDAMQLRAGSTIELDHPGTFNATIRVGELPLAEGELRVFEDRVELKVVRTVR